MVLFLSIVTALQYGIGDFAGGTASRRNSAVVVIVLSQLIGLLLGAVALFLLRTPISDTIDLMWGSLSGLGGALGLTFLYYGLASGIVAIVSPAAALVGAAVPVVFGLIMGERIGVAGLSGILLVFLSIAALTWTGRRERKKVKSVFRSLSLGILAGMGFGLFFIFISRTGEQSGLWPLIAARATSVGLLTPIALMQRKKLDGTGKAIAPLVLAGILDMGANITLLISLRAGLVIVVTAISSLYPAPTVVLAGILFHERLSAIKWIGLVLAVVGVALLGLE